MTPAVLCAGRLYCDLIFTGVPRFPTPGTEVFAGGLALHAGGGAFITGATLSALGNATGLSAILPAAPFDAVVAAEMTRHRLGTDLCRPAADGADPQVTVAVTTDQDRAFLTRADGPAMPDLTAADLAPYRHLHIGELRTLQDHPALLTLARACGMTVSVDCSWQDVFAADAADLIAQVDLFLPNAQEADALHQIGIPEDCAALTVIKCGKDGARARRRGDESWVQVPSRAVPVVDATGAGDAFNAGFISRWLAGAALDHCITSGNACGAIAVGSAGGAGGLARVAEAFADSLT